VSSIHTRTWRPKATTTSEERERRDGRGDVVKGRRTLRQGRQPCAPHSRAARGGRGGYSRKSVVSSIHPPDRALATGGVRGVAWRECIACAHAERAPRGGAGMPSYVIVLARGSWSVHGVVLVGSGATKTQRGACAVRGELSEMRGVSVWCLRAHVFADSKGACGVYVVGVVGCRRFRRRRADAGGSGVCAFVWC